MAKSLDEYGQLDVTQLTVEEKKEIFEKFKDMVLKAELEWSTKYGPFEIADDSSEEEFAAKLETTPDNLIWADVNYFDEAEYLSPAEGLTLGLNGWANLPGRQDFYTVDRYLIASHPWDETAPRYVYSFAQCLCPFCERGEIDGVSCEICEGNYNWEVDC